MDPDHLEQGISASSTDVEHLSDVCELTKKDLRLNETQSMDSVGNCKRCQRDYAYHTERAPAEPLVKSMHLSEGREIRISAISGERFTIQLSDHATVSELESQIQAHMNCPPELQMLTVNGNTLTNTLLSRTSVVDLGYDFVGGGGRPKIEFVGGTLEWMVLHFLCFDIRYQQPPSLMQGEWANGYMCCMEGAFGPKDMTELQLGPLSVKNGSGFVVVLWWMYSEGYIDYTFPFLSCLKDFEIPTLPDDIPGYQWLSNLFSGSSSGGGGRGGGRHRSRGGGY